MKATLHHAVYFIHDFKKNIDLYKKLFNYFGFSVLYETDENVGFRDEKGNTSVWFLETTEKSKNHRDANGLNHLAFGLSSKADVDTFIEEFLKPNNIELLFDTPRSRPEFSQPGADYYQVMFELPGDLLFEVVFTS